MSKYVKNEENANRLLDWLDNGAPHVVFSLAVAYADPAEFTEKLDAGDIVASVPTGRLQSADEIPSDCGAIACIAGAASQMAKGTFGQAARDTHRVAWKETQTAALEFLGIDADYEYIHSDRSENVHMHPLFCPDHAESEMGRKALAADAAVALRNMIAYGEPRWEELA